MSKDIPAPMTYEERARKMLREMIIRENDSAGDPSTWDWYFTVMDNRVSLVFHDDATHEHVKVAEFELRQR